MHAHINIFFFASYSSLVQLYLIYKMSTSEKDITLREMFNMIMKKFDQIDARFDKLEQMGDSEKVQEKPEELQEISESVQVEANHVDDNFVPEEKNVSKPNFANSVTSLRRSSHHKKHFRRMGSLYSRPKPRQCLINGKIRKNCRNMQRSRSKQRRSHESGQFGNSRHSDNNPSSHGKLWRHPYKLSKLLVCKKLKEVFDPTKQRMPHEEVVKITAQADYGPHHNSSFRLIIFCL